MNDKLKQVADSRQTFMSLLTRTIELIFDWVEYVKSMGQK